MGKPFAWTAGRNLFKWFGSLGVDEETFRDNVYMAAVCRCFPGKNPKGGDRVPSDVEIENCAPWLQREIEICRPELIIPVGKLAIARFLDDAPLAETIGKRHVWRCDRRDSAAASVRRVDLVSRRAGQDADEKSARAHRQASRVAEDQSLVAERLRQLDDEALAVADARRRRQPAAVRARDLIRHLQRQRRAGRAGWRGDAVRHGR